MIQLISFKYHCKPNSYLSCLGILWDGIMLACSFTQYVFFYILVTTQGCFTQTYHRPSEGNMKMRWKSFHCTTSLTTTHCFFYLLIASLGSLNVFYGIALLIFVEFKCKHILTLLTVPIQMHVMFLSTVMHVNLVWLKKFEQINISDNSNLFTDKQQNFLFFNTPVDFCCRSRI